VFPKAPHSIESRALYAWLGKPNPEGPDTLFKVSYPMSRKIRESRISPNTWEIKGEVVFTRAGMNADLALIKRTMITERFSLDFRTEVSTSRTHRRLGLRMLSLAALDLALSLRLAIRA